jgi:hypothetical protein
MARPSDYTVELAQNICEQVANGLALKKICEPEEMPARATVYLWLHAHKEFVDMYARAKEDCADLFAEELMDIADTGSGDVNRDRLRVDTRKWVAAKLKPRKYGDKVTHEGSVENPIRSVNRIELVDLDGSGSGSGQAST